MWQRAGLARKSVRNLFGIVRAIYDFQLDEMAQSRKPVLSPWLVKWRKVAPQKPCNKRRRTSRLRKWRPS